MSENLPISLAVRFELQKGGRRQFEAQGRGVQGVRRPLSTLYSFFFCTLLPAPSFLLPCVLPAAGVLAYPPDALWSRHRPLPQPET